MPITAKQKLALEISLPIAGMIIIGLIVFLVLYLRQSSTSPTPTPTVTISASVTIPSAGVPVTITTEINGNVYCIAFDNAATLQFGNCGNTSIQGSWVYDTTFDILTNSVSLTTRSNCMINPSVINNPIIRGQPVSQSQLSCRNITFSSGFIKGKTDANQDVYIGLVANQLAWVQDLQDANVFEIAF